MLAAAQPANRLPRYYNHGMPRYAAIDIGSNSVRMEAAEVSDGEPTRILASERQVTRLGASVFRNGRISLEAMDLVCGVLAGMATTYRRLEVNGIRAVATAAVRDASNQHEFIARTSAALGNDIEIISGQEEARLIHLGVKSRWPHPKERFLIIDIGGGSAEIILSENERIIQSFSKPLGALRLQELFVRTDPPRASEIHRLGEYIEERIGSAVRRIGGTRIDRVIGTSATASAVVCAVNRIPRARRDESDRRRAGTPQIRRLLKEVSAMDLAQRQKMTGIGPRRAEIIIPGAAVLLHVLEAFRMPALFYSSAGVRDGIIADLAARRVERGLSQLSPDQRSVVEQTAEHYGISLRRARKVARLAADLFHGFQSIHKLPPESGRLLEAAAYLYDSGHYVSDTRHHKHSYYLVANSDLPGFTRAERELIANLCRYHRKALPTPEHPNLQMLDAEGRRSVTLLNPLLRMADSLDRSRGQRVRSVECKIRENDFLITVVAASETDIDLELWAAERLSEIFRQLYGKPTTIARA
jgi:exopolyphosphatase/guanosine-5'-triphosphate,3'-diphosphate pyrophosphatase